MLQIHIYPEKKKKNQKGLFSKLPPMSQKTRFPIHPIIYKIETYFEISFKVNMKIFKWKSNDHFIQTKFQTYYKHCGERNEEG